MDADQLELNFAWNTDAVLDLCKDREIDDHNIRVFMYLAGHSVWGNTVQTTAYSAAEWLELPLSTVVKCFDVLNRKAVMARVDDNTVMVNPTYCWRLPWDGHEAAQERFDALRQTN